MISLATLATTLAICFLCLPQFPTARATEQLLSPPERLAEAVKKCRRDFELPTNEADESLQLKCMVDELALWSDERGYDVPGIVEFFEQFNSAHEIAAVVNHCNTVHRDTANPVKWAYNAYKCATSGTVGEWLREYATSLNIID